MLDVRKEKPRFTGKAPNIKAEKCLDGTLTLGAVMNNNKEVGAKADSLELIMNNQAAMIRKFRLGVGLYYFSPHAVVGEWVKCVRIVSGTKAERCSYLATRPWNPLTDRILTEVNEAE